MSDPAVPLSPEAVMLLFEVLETPEALLSCQAAEIHASATTALVERGLLTRHDYEEVTASNSNHEDAPVTLTWSDQASGLCYFDSVSGITEVSSGQVIRRKVNADKLLAAISSDFRLLPPPGPIELIDGLLWEIGNARLPGRSSPVSIWFARRVWSRSVQREITANTRARPTRTQRLILTSSPRRRLGETSIEGALIIPLEDVLAHPGSLALSVDTLSALVSGVPNESSSGPIQLSPDGKQLRIENGEAVHFRSEMHIEAIRRLVAAYYKGERISAAALTSHGSLSRFFGAKKWATLSTYIRSRNGLWSFEL